ncbi:MAG TPA: hypothetical protein VF595_15520 [Tepidisphaeraceae bacterium]
MQCDATGRLASSPGRRAWYFMHALGRAALPDEVTVADRRFRATEFIKHDFFAATGFYTDVATGDRVVLKMSRTEPFLGLPMRWLGRLISERELRFYHRLADLPNVPAVIGRVGRTGLVHAYVAGQPLKKGVSVPDGFFAELNDLITTMAARGIAIVDTNKPENILLGHDGRPYLIDFQISFDVKDLFGLWPAGPLLRLFTRTDRYHVRKHKSRLRPDLMTPEEIQAVSTPMWPIRLHRRLTRPYFIIRRRLFAHLRATGRLMPEGSK